MSGLLDAIRGGGGPEAVEPLLDAMLMVALAQGEVDGARYDRIAQVMRSTAVLAEVDWDQVTHRAEVLAEDAPLFFETRQTLPSALPDSAQRRVAFRLAVLVVGPEGPTDEERMVLNALAGALGIQEAEAESLRASSDGTLRPLVRCALNDPSFRRSKTWAEALKEAEDDDQRRLLLHKFEGIRRLLWSRPEARIVKTSERLEFGRKTFRLDAVLEQNPRRLLVRLLGPGEALHEDERPMMRQLSESLPESARLMVAHASDLSAADRSFLSSFDPERVEVVALA